MASKITMKTRVADATAPTAGASGDLSVGELAINSFAGKLYGGVHIGATTAAGSQASGATAALLSWHGLEIDAFTDGTGITVADTDKLLVTDATDGAEKYINASQLSSYLGSGDIDGIVTASNSGLAGGTTSGTATLVMDINNLAAEAIASGDMLAFNDATDNGIHKESIDDVAALFAGDGLTASSAVLAVGAGTGIDVSANAIAVDPSDFLTNLAGGRILYGSGSDATTASADFTYGSIFGNENGDYEYLEVGNSGTKTTTPQRVLQLKSSTSGTVAAGFGTGIMFTLEQPTDNLNTAGAIDVTWESVVDGSEAAQMEFFLESGGSEISQTGSDSQVMVLSSGGNLQIDGDMTVTGNNLVFGNGEEIRNTTNGQIDLDAGVIEVGTGGGNPIIQSDGDHNIILRTGNSTTGSITITDGANGDIDIAPNGSGVTNVGNLTASSTVTFNGHTTIGSDASDNLTINADINSHVTPQSDSTYELGSSSLYWSHGYIDAITTTGNTAVGGDLTVTGGLTVNGTTTTVNSTTMTVDDPIITLGGDSAPGSDDNKDRGVEFRYHDGSNARVGFFGWDDSATGFTGLTAATNTSEVFSGTVMNATFGDIAGTLTTGAQTNITSLGTQTSALSMGENNITNVGDINCDSISIDSASVGLTIDGSGANTSKFEILMNDNVQNGLEIKQGSNNYMTFDTRNSAELIVFHQELDINAVSDFGSNAMTNVNIDSGTIDGATIATSDVTVGSGKTLDVSSGTLTLANNQISGDKVEGGTIAATTITALTLGSMAGNWTNAGRTIADLGTVTTVDINGGTIDNATIANCTINGGTF